MKRSEMNILSETINDGVPVLTAFRCADLELMRSQGDVDRSVADDIALVLKLTDSIIDRADVSRFYQK